MSKRFIALLAAVVLTLSCNASAYAMEPEAHHPDAGIELASSTTNLVFATDFRSASPVKTVVITQRTTTYHARGVTTNGQSVGMLLNINDRYGNYVGSISFDCDDTPHPGSIYLSAGTYQMQFVTAGYTTGISQAAVSFD